MPNQYDRFKSLCGEYTTSKDKDVTLKIQSLAAYIWKRAIDYANKAGFPTTLGFLQYIWAGFYFCIRDIIHINGIEYKVKEAFFKSTCAVFQIQEDEKHILPSIWEHQNSILEKLSKENINAHTKEGIVSVQDTVLFLATMDSDDEPFVPDAIQEFEFIIAVTSVIEFAASSFPQTKSESKDPRQSIQDQSKTSPSPVKTPEHKPSKSQVPQSSPPSPAQNPYKRAYIIALIVSACFFLICVILGLRYYYDTQGLKQAIANHEQTIQQLEADLKTANDNLKYKEGHIQIIRNTMQQRNIDSYNEGVYDGYVQGYTAAAKLKGKAKTVDRMTFEEGYELTKKISALYRKYSE